MSKPKTLDDIYWQLYVLNQKLGCALCDNALDCKQIYPDTNKYPGETNPWRMCLERKGCTVEQMNPYAGAAVCPKYHPS